ncbi:hypothetical protein [Arthrobacter sp. NPDC090010]|uniref:hypothetical protein n=1 Tax=Arthrobacter sp. NPDC090010 TaxID=3363942 RepID=UPI0037FBA3B3
MSEHSGSTTPQPTSGQGQIPSTPGARKSRTLMWVILGAALLVVLVIAYFIAAAVVPVEWAKNIAGQAGPGSSGVFLGLGYGFFLTFLSLWIAWQSTHRRISWPWKAVILLAAVAVSIPNLLTAAVSWGSSNSVHQAQRIIGTGPTWFPLWSGIGAISGAVIFVVALVLWKLWRRRGQQARLYRTVEKQRVLEEKEAARAAERAARQQNPENT